MSQPRFAPFRFHAAQHRSKFQRLQRQIETRGLALAAISTDELRKASLGLRYRALSGEPLDHLLPEAFALVREASVRAIGLKHYDVQLFAGIALHYGRIAVMQTGEGKTLTATAPLYLAALRGRGAHLITANDYLARRDAESMRPIFILLGMSVGFVVSQSLHAERHAAYRCDVTYTTAKEVGFDFLRDRILHRQRELGLTNRFSQMIETSQTLTENEPVQRTLEFAVIDEADNILIDEARTPLVVSQSSPQGNDERKPLFEWAARMTSEFIEEQHFSIDSQRRKITLTSDGRQLTRRLANTPELATLPTIDIYEQMELALLVDRYYVRDQHYITRENEIIIVDEFTGRLAEGRKWRAGLHQAIEAREQVQVTGETHEAARITLQDLFLKYNRLAGMTGTIGNSGSELATIYGTPVLEIPTHRPPQRRALPDRVFATAEEKWRAIADEVAQLHREGRPVLIGTRSIDKSIDLSNRLTSLHIEHHVLNAKEHEPEAEIIAHAGEFRRVTVATNMAGRGTDIRLDAASLELGGLHVICSELHESARIDRQLIGRCGRQGDPGSFRQYMSLEDELLDQGLSEKRVNQLRRLSSRHPRQWERYAGLFRSAQRKIEANNFQARKILMYLESQQHLLQTEMGLDPYLDAPSS